MMLVGPAPLGLLAIPFLGFMAYTHRESTGIQLYGEAAGLEAFGKLCYRYMY